VSSRFYDTANIQEFETILPWHRPAARVRNYADNNSICRIPKEVDHVAEIIFATFTEAAPSTTS
jgi:hypothetical protein